MLMKAAFDNVPNAKRRQYFSSEIATSAFEIKSIKLKVPVFV